MMKFINGTWGCAIIGGLGGIVGERECCQVNDHSNFEEG